MNVSSQRLRVLLTAVSGLFIPVCAWAHPGNEGVHDAFAGMLHPFTGLDHILAMVAVGLWATRLGRRARYVLPVVFPAMMLAGGWLSSAGVALPGVEAIIAASVIVLGILIAAAVRVSLFGSALLVGTFAVFHGYAHVNEAAHSDWMLYAAGFLASTCMLHVIGLGFGSLMTRPNSAVPRVSGSLIAIAGAALLMAG
ncbi:MAG: HupE/UreJ family protein [Povalibacter sp.]